MSRCNPTAAQNNDKIICLIVDVALTEEKRSPRIVKVSTIARLEAFQRERALVRCLKRPGYARPEHHMHTTERYDRLSRRKISYSCLAPHCDLNSYFHSINRIDAGDQHQGKKARKRNPRLRIRTWNFGSLGKRTKKYYHYTSQGGKQIKVTIPFLLSWLKFWVCPKVQMGIKSGLGLPSRPA